MYTEQLVPCRKSLPVVVAIIAFLGIFGAVGCLARLAGGCADDVVARLAIGLRLLIVGLAGLIGLEESIGGRRLDCCGGCSGGRPGFGGGTGGGLRLPRGLVITIIIPPNVILLGSGCSGSENKLQGHEQGAIPLRRSLRLASAVSMLCLKK